MNIIQDLIPTSNSNRPGTSIDPTFITVHETANTSNGANAESHARYVKGADAQNRQVSWHYTVDDTEIYQHLPTNEIGWHAGATGNRQSVGIELCVNSDGNFTATRARGIELVRSLMNQLNVPLSRVVSHQHWTGKNCPANLLSVWDSFINEIANSEGSDSIGTVRVLASELWVYNQPDWNARHQIVRRDEVFTVVRELFVNGSKMYELRSGLFITANTQFVQFNS
ncbi:peptidoglycan recognition protein family protein [Alkalicoccobacillus murimartini]|uniref:N-acetylmuramoyl-L-alanine amidase n=1 Tax=Alkalicoccobacillus murimartini TaxID=171685 RepID=A0ABT9YIU7_9BACI|nr:N-acetylmuramoyl-L-alanine amidase [Alkalicoccobacillus murimartini]MDQ0207451.1 N-acetylmuramoyl-L-alanine amidase [Alkalicoccobacillus murimartini]